MALNLRQIEVFRAVMTTGSISAAARVLCVSQPAVSRLLSYTESRLGFPLFQRIKGRLYPTPEARELFRRVDDVYQGVQRVNECAQELAELRHGIVHVVASPSISHQIVPHAITRFREQHPDVKVTLRGQNYGALVDSLVSHEAELGITIMPVAHPNLTVTPLRQGRIVCIVPYGHPLGHRARLQIADLRQYPLIGYAPGTPFGRLVETMYEQADEPLRVAVEVPSPQNACSIVAAGAGVALVDEFSVKSRTAGEFVVRPIDEGAELTVSLVHSSFEPLSLLARAFADRVTEVLEGQGFEQAGESA
ncbi:LysR substrate-binding domain-containing protein [Robbsia sp. KACC 23696]|uniref:LysR substrate-binding domain-containing protein n=1 Tax=Robbsia sp. KACC 23696 TaxID=3149231 RepID=UPI00325BCED5